MQQTRENLIEEFSWRGLIAQVSNEERLVGHLGAASQRLLWL